jgi:hypothetical protein
MQGFFGSFYNVQKKILNMGQRLHYETCTFKRIEKFHGPLGWSVGCLSAPK